MSSFFNYVLASVVPTPRVQERMAYSLRESEHHLRRPRQVIEPRIRHLYHRRGGSDPNLNSSSRDLDQSGYERDPRPGRLDSQDVAAVVQGVAAVVRDELDGLLQDIDARIQPALEANQLTSQPTIQKDDPSAKCNAKIASQGDRIKELEAMLQTAESEKKSRDQEFLKVERENRLTTQKLRQSDSKFKKLQEVILGSSLRSPEFDDDQIQKGFRKLRYDIFQLVKKYCTNHNASLKNTKYSCLSNEAKDFWVMSMVASALYKQCFSKSLYFGFDLETDNKLNAFYSSVGAF